MAQTSHNSQSANHLIFQLGGKIEELFVQQYDRIAFHNNVEENDYRRTVEQLASLMLDKSLANEKRIEHARAVIALTEKYKHGFLGPLQALNEDIERHLDTFAKELDSILGQVHEPTQDLRTLLESLQRWLSLSKELQKARLLAAHTIIMRVDCDKQAPNAIIRNDGHADAMLTADEAAQFRQMLADVLPMLQQSSEENDRIQQERLPLSQMLFSSEASSTETKTPTEAKPQPTTQAAVRIHPLEGKTWFRLFKVVYICLWILAAGSCLLLAVADASTAALVTGIASVVVLISLRKGFYYVMLGRTTVTEPPGTGFLDWDELKKEFDSLRATNPELYQTLVAPFLSAWKEQYGRRVPIQAWEALWKNVNSRIDAELEELEAKKQKLIDDAAKKGRAMEISALRENMEKAKSAYQGPDRAAYIRGIDDWIMKLEAKYGTSIPVDEASRILDELEDKIRDQEKN
jgi:hypothetical protein